MDPLDLRATSRGRSLIKAVPAIGVSVAAVLILMVIVCTARRKPPHRDYPDRLQVACKARLCALVEFFRLNIEEYGGMPYSASLPEIVDPMCKGWPLRDWGLLACPFNAESREGRLVDSGFRTFNWPSATWRLVHQEVCRGKPPVPQYPPGEVPVGREVPPGLMIAWTSQPVREAKRYVQILPIYGGSFTQDDPVSRSATSTYLLNDSQFEAKMQEIRRALAAMESSEKRGEPGSAPAKKSQQAAPASIGDKSPPRARFQVYTDWPFDPQEARRRQETTAQALGLKIEQDFDLGNGAKMRMVLIPAGEFMMGSPPSEEGRYHDEDLHHVVIDKPFYIGKYEVTQEQWEAVMGDNPSETKKPRNPVDNVSWDDAQVFLGKLNNRSRNGTFSLATEAQWEYACRAGSEKRFCFGDHARDLARYGWYGVTAESRPREVGLLLPNAWGVHDMHGNVYEWCASPYSDCYDGRELKGAEGKGIFRVFRSGSVGIEAGSCRSASRFRLSPSHRGTIGMRAWLIPKALE